MMIATDTGALILSALSLVALHSATNNQYGFHRDELATIDDARFLGWGYRMPRVRAEVTSLER
jgi:hypothetical protein